jgi:type I restriction enzyme S subunit
MTYLDKLLIDVDVEWKTLGDEKVIEIANSGRKPVKSSERIVGENPYYGANNIQDFVDGFTHDGTFVLIAEDGTASVKNYSIQWASGKFWANNHVHVIRGRENVDSRFLFHYLKTVNFVPFLSGGDRAKLTKGRLIEIPIPIPPLEIQQKIVEILDSFTELSAELTAELTARKRQFEYYREKLLTFEDGKVEWKELGEAINLQRGKRLIKSQLEETGEYAVYQNALTPLGYYHESNAKAFTTFVICAGAAGEIGFSDVNFWAADDITFCIAPNNINNKFVYYYLQIQQHKIMSQVRRASVPRLSKDVLVKIKIPIPSLEEQNRIVSILDKFDILTTSIGDGLPKEIELRKKQYEYYRDLLLTFPKKEIA